MRSAREDGRGHWPRGRRAHPRPPRGLLRALARALEQPERGSVSIRAAAEACRVSDRTVRRWLAGEDWPAPVSARRLERWVEWARRR